MISSESLSNNAAGKRETAGKHARMNKPTVPAGGNTYQDRDPRNGNRRVKVTKLLRSERKAVCENTKTGKSTRISYAVLAARFDRV